LQIWSRRIPSSYRFYKILCAGVRILVITIDFRVGGTETYLNRVAPMLRARHGIEVDFFLLDRLGLLIEEAQRNGIAVLGRRRSRFRAKGPAGALSATFDIAEVLRQRRYDAVHTYLYLADVIGTAAAQLRRIPRVIVSRRAVSPRRPSGPVFRLLETLSNMIADELIANSAAVLRDVEATEWALPALRTVIYNGVDADRYGVAAPRTSGPLRLVSVGTLARRKGQRTALQALRSARAAGIDAHLTLVGSGPDEVILARTAATLELTEHVRFAGFQSDPAPFLRDADLFLLPSEQEGFSNVLIEAMAVGLPVIATSVGGNAEAVVDGEGGIIVPSGDPEAMFRAIATMSGDRQHLATRGLANRDRVRERFSLERSVDDLARWYLRPVGS
jgi:glycosyltransferase involved in cell wall biosynthesis